MSAFKALIGAAAAALIAYTTGAPSARAAEPMETPSLESQVAAGTLPAVRARLPIPHAVAALDGKDQALGEHGGASEILMGRQKDVRMMTVYGYARLVRYDQDLNLKPDILKAVDVEEGRIFTFHIRPGHKWSDGHPFTSEDFRYWWEDLANNDQLAPGGVPRELLVNGEQPKFEVIDTHTVRYTFPSPNPTFLSAIAAARRVAGSDRGSRTSRRPVACRRGRRGPETCDRAARRPRRPPLGASRPHARFRREARP